MAGDDEVRTAVDAINLAIEGLPDDVHVMMHICQGNYAVGPDYDGQIGHRYFDQGRYKADLVCEIDCDGYLIEHDMTPHYEGCLGDKQLGVGAVDVQAPNVETGEQVAERIRAHRWLAPEQTIITSSCGFNHLPRHIALGKLRAMTEAKAILLRTMRVGTLMTELETRITTREGSLRLDERLRLAEAAERYRRVRARSGIRAMGVEPAGSGALRDRSARSARDFRGLAAQPSSSMTHPRYVRRWKPRRRAAAITSNSGSSSRMAGCAGLPARARWTAGRLRRRCCAGPFTKSTSASSSKRGCSRSTRRWKPASASCARKRARSKSSIAPAWRLAQSLTLSGWFRS